MSLKSVQHLFVISLLPNHLRGAVTQNLAQFSEVNTSEVSVNQFLACSDHSFHFKIFYKAIF